MADHTHIEWTDATWNPVTGCTVVSPGCTNCYAMKLAGTRLKHHWSRIGLTIDTKAGPVWNGKVRFNEDWLDQPLRWKKPRMIFVCAHGDLFHEDVPDAWIDQVFAVMALSRHHTFQVLTKRPERMRDYIGELRDGRRVYELACDMVIEHGLNVILIPHPMFEQVAPPGPRVHLGRWPLRNVWLGTSVEDQRRADERIPHLLATPAAVRFVSAEPLLGPVDLTGVSFGGGVVVHALEGKRWDVFDESGGEKTERYAKLHWVIVGGESGDGARPMHPDWARSLRDQCAAAGVPFFFKQWGSWAPVNHMTDEQVDACFHPAPARDPEATRVARQASTVVHHNGSRHDHAAREAFVQGQRAMTMFDIGKKAAGRLLDGVEHSGMPGPDLHD